MPCHQGPGRERRWEVCRKTRSGKRRKTGGGRANGVNSQNPRGCARALAPRQHSPEPSASAPTPLLRVGGVRGVQETWILAFWEPEAVLDAQGAVGTRTPRTWQGWPENPALVRTQRLRPRVHHIQGELRRGSPSMRKRGGGGVGAWGSHPGAAPRGLSFRHSSSHKGCI